MREKKITGKGKFVFLSRIHPKKNLLNAIGFFDNVKGQAIFDIYGPIEDEEYWKECQGEIKRLPININANYCGLVSHDEVHEIFSKYDAFLFPTLSENYGHVIAESLSVGTTVIISDQTPWINLQIKNAGWDISLIHKEKFENAIQQIIDIDDNEYERMSVSAKKYFYCISKLEELKNAYSSAILNIKREIK